MLSKRLLPTLLPILWIAMAGALSAQPVITDVLDGAALTVNIAQGSVFVVKGTGLSPAGFLQSSGPAYPTLLNGVKVSLTPAAGGTAIPIFMVYTYNYIGDTTVAVAARINQLSLVVPSTVAVGAYDVRVTNGSATSAAFRTNVVLRKPGIVSASGDGTGIAQATLQGALILDRTSAQGFIGLFDTRPAHPNDVMTLWMTGLGPDAVADNGVSTLGDMTAAGSIRVVFDGNDITPAYAGRSQGYPGLDQVNFTIPASVVLSCTNTVQVRAGGVLSNLLTIATSAPTATSCPAPSTSSGSAPSLSQSEISTILASGVFREGIAQLTKSNGYTYTDTGTGTTTSSQTTSNGYQATFEKASGSDLNNLLTTYLPTLVSSAGQCLVNSSFVTPFPNLTFAYLDAGSSQGVSGSGGSQTAAKGTQGSLIYYQGTFPAGYVTSGAYTFTGPGGTNVGSYSGNYTLGPELLFTNVAAAAVIARSSPFTINWTGGDAGTLLNIVLESTSGSTSVSVQCNANVSDGTFTIPSAILAQLPASPTVTTAGQSHISRGSLSISAQGTGTRIAVSGMDYFTLTNTWSTSTSVQYK